jgi:phosphatidylethanolamine-binding protein (PEBP) family uncharacterized protein
MSPPIQWKTVPRGTTQLAIFVVNLKPVNDKPFFDWAITDINPRTHNIPAGTTPPDVITGRNSYGTTGYSICPPKGTHEAYVIRLAALPHPLPAHPSFNPEAYYREAEKTASTTGLTVTKYTRP